MPRKPLSVTTTPRLSAGGNPQLPKGDGDAIVQQWITAIPGWKRTIGEELDSLITATVPAVRKAIRWNTPFYGIKDNGWFMAFHCLNKYIKVAFLHGTALVPPPPVSSKQLRVRYLHLFESNPPDRLLLANWILQASQLPGENVF